MAKIFQFPARPYTVADVIKRASSVIETKSKFGRINLNAIFNIPFNKKMTEEEYIGLVNQIIIDTTDQAKDE